MITPTAEQLLDYVRASAALQGIHMDDARAQRVAQHLARTAQLAQLLEEAPLAPHDEPAELYKPAPFAPVIDRRNA